MPIELSEYDEMNKIDSMKSKCVYCIYLRQQYESQRLIHPEDPLIRESLSTFLAASSFS